MRKSKFFILSAIVTLLLVAFQSVVVAPIVEIKNTIEGQRIFAYKNKKQKENLLQNKLEVKPQYKTLDVKVTAYDLSVQSCGKKRSHKEYGISRGGFNLRGHTRESAMAIAADLKVIPLNSIINLEFKEPEYQIYNGIYTVRDSGRLIKGKKVDLFFGDFGEKSSKKTLDFGITDAKLIILYEGQR